MEEGKEGEGLSAMLMLVSLKLKEQQASICFRNHNGQFILAWTAWKFVKLSTIEGEAAVLFEAWGWHQAKALIELFFEVKPVPRTLVKEVKRENFREKKKNILSF